MAGMKGVFGELPFWRIYAWFSCYWYEWQADRCSYIGVSRKLAFGLPYRLTQEVRREFQRISFLDCRMLLLRNFCSSCTSLTCTLHFPFCTSNRSWKTTDILCKSFSNILKTIILSLYICFRTLNPDSPYSPESQTSEGASPISPSARSRPKRVSNLLLLAMFSIAARYSARGNESVPPPQEGSMWTAGDTYLGDAKVILDSTYAASRPSTCQALLLMGYREVGIGAMAQAWLYLGMAVRMAQDLGLHKSAEKWSTIGKNLFTSVELQERRRIWYGCIIMDKYLSTYIGQFLFLLFLFSWAMLLMYVHLVQDVLLRFSSGTLILICLMWTIQRSWSCGKITRHPLCKATTSLIRWTPSRATLFRVSMNRLNYVSIFPFTLSLISLIVSWSC